MGTRTKILMMGASLVMLGSLPVMAAELPPPPGPPAQDDHSCFYLRGDIGVGVHEEPTITKGGSSATDPTLQDNLLVEVGAGCQVNRYFRGDVTVGYRDASKMREDFNDLNGNISTVTVLANAYVDLAHLGNLTPYIGVGAGAAFHDMDGVSLPAGSGDSNQTEFAWAVYAGVSYNLTQSITLDAGYRFIDLGSPKSGGASKFKVDDFESHDFRIGLRWYFGT